MPGGDHGVVISNKGVGWLQQVAGKADQIQIKPPNFGLQCEQVQAQLGCWLDDMRDADLQTVPDEIALVLPKSPERTQHTGLPPRAGTKAKR